MYIAWVELKMKPLGAIFGSQNLAHRLEEKETVLVEIKDTTGDTDAVIKAHQQAERERSRGGWGECRVIKVAEVVRELHIIDD